MSSRDISVCIIGAQNLKHMTGAGSYFDFLSQRGIQYDIVYVDKYAEPESSSARQVFPMRLDISPEWSKWRKIWSYAKFRGHVRRVLFDGEYDWLVIWGTETAMLLGDTLMRNRNRYILNIRDYGPMGKPGVSPYVKTLVSGAALTTISSRAFKEWLPDGDYLPMVVAPTESGLAPARRAAPGESIKICFIGNVRFYEQDVRLINAFANDERFILQFFGVGSERLEEYCAAQGIVNVEFVGSFDSSRTDELLGRAHVINNLYGRGVPELDTAVSLKYRHALNHGLPILVYRGTAMETVSSGISYAFGGDFAALPNAFYEWYTGLDWDGFEEARSGHLTRLRHDSVAFEQALERLWSKGERA